MARTRTKRHERSPAKDLLDDGSDIWQISFIRELWKTVRADDSVDFRVSALLNVWEQDQHEDQSVQPRHRLDRVSLLVDRE